jgi:hypothetical protein
MNERTKARVRERAGHRCEYCRLHQDDSPLAALHIEHIIPKVHGGTDNYDNLALACRFLMSLLSKTNRITHSTVASRTSNRFNLWR